jgi:hypothetical protein
MPLPSSAEIAFGFDSCTPQENNNVNQYHSMKIETLKRTIPSVHAMSKAASFSPSKAEYVIFRGRDGRSYRMFSKSEGIDSPRKKHWRTFDTKSKAAALREPSKV